jgi:hypothetical protein
MQLDKKSAIFPCSGFLLVMLGSSPLNGYFGFQLWPAEFHRDAFIGTIGHLLLGLIPWLLGVAFLSISFVKAWQFLPAGLVGVGTGFLLVLPSFINAKDHKGCLGWLTIVIVGILLATAIGTVVSAWKMIHGHNNRASAATR